jgi:magnesium chelatase subunit I
MPITLPINATEDRVVGGFRIDALLRSQAVWHKGLLEQADGTILYVDEVNLLDDHIVNIILDVASTGILEIEREGANRRVHSRFSLIGTMNPEEGGLRPQLLDRFDLAVTVRTEPEHRAQILRNVLAFDQASVLPSESYDNATDESFLTKMNKEDEKKRRVLMEARTRLRTVKIDDEILERCVRASSLIRAEGSRGERVLALASRACAALANARNVTPEHLKRVAPMALQHRRTGTGGQVFEAWDQAQLDEVLQVLA